MSLREAQSAPVLHRVEGKRAGRKWDKARKEERWEDEGAQRKLKAKKTTLISILLNDGDMCETEIYVCSPFYCIFTRKMDQITTSREKPSNFGSCSWLEIEQKQENKYGQDWELSEVRECEEMRSEGKRRKRKRRVEFKGVEEGEQ